MPVIRVLGLVILFLFGGMDLPLPPVRFGDPLPSAPVPIIIAPDPEEEDPRDTPPPVFYGEEIDVETDSIVYVIDISASMNLDGRLQRAQSELIHSVHGLADSFLFNAYAYSDTVYGFSAERVPATLENKIALMVWIMGYNARGWTATGPACAQALSEKDNLSVVLLTDGVPNYGVSMLALGPNTPPAQQLILQSQAHRKVIREANTQGATVDVFGIAATGAHRVFCQGVASDSGGSYRDVP